MNSIKRSVVEVVDRIQAPTPTHFKRIIIFGLVLVIIGLGLILVAACFPSPTWLAIKGELANKCIEIGLTMAGVSITARDDKK